jgi:SAM-dependent methyltransferase
VDRPPWAPPEVDINRPSASRVYDYFLGGCHNFAADRELARQILEMEPATTRVANANRAFLGRAVRELVALGIDQFLDIGSGIPTIGNVHEIAQGQKPGVRVVYVDIDPVAVAHSQLILKDNPDAGVVQADLRNPASIIDDPVTREMLDFDRPIAVLLVSVLHFVSDKDDPAGSIARLRDRLAPGSYLVISQLAELRDDPADPDWRSAAHEHYSRMVAALTLRRKEEVAALFDGFTLIEPGLVTTAEWRPDGEPDDVAAWAGVGRLD